MKEKANGNRKYLFNRIDYENKTNIQKEEHKYKKLTLSDFQNQQNLLQLQFNLKEFFVFRSKEKYNLEILKRDRALSTVSSKRIGFDSEN